MASRYGITQPNGVRFTLIYDQEQSKIEQIEKLILKPWTGYCLKNWLSDGQGVTPESKVKRLLDRCGTLLLRDVAPDSRDTLTSYKECVIGSREISLSDCPEAIANMAESGYMDKARLSPDDKLRYQLLIEQLNEKHAVKKNRPIKKTSTRFERLEAIRRTNPGCRMEISRVDVEGCFECFAEWYQVDSIQGKYAPHHTRYGEQYDMDRIIGIRTMDGKVFFADQDGYMIPDEQITKREKVAI